MHEKLENHMYHSLSNFWCCMNFWSVMLLGLISYRVWHTTGLQSKPANYNSSIFYMEKCYFVLWNSKAGMIQTWSFRRHCYFPSSINTWNKIVWTYNEWSQCTEKQGCELSKGRDEVYLWSSQLHDPLQSLFNLNYLSWVSATGNPENRLTYSQPVQLGLLIWHMCCY